MGIFLAYMDAIAYTFDIIGRSRDGFGAAFGKQSMILLPRIWEADRGSDATYSL